MAAFKGRRDDSGRNCKGSEWSFKVNIFLGNSDSDVMVTCDVDGFLSRPSFARRAWFLLNARLD